MKSLVCSKAAAPVFFLLLVFFTGTANAQTQQAILIRGNDWQSGIPGFGSNVFSALFGEYEVETINTAGETGSFSVRASPEALRFDDQWRPWPGIANAVQRTEGGSLLVGLHFDAPNNMGSWVIVFQFPQGVSGMDEAAINRFIRAWNGRFGYFLSLVKNFFDVSLPATLAF